MLKSIGLHHSLLQRQLIRCSRIEIVELPELQGLVSFLLPTISINENQSLIAIIINNNNFEKDKCEARDKKQPNLQQLIKHPGVVIQNVSNYQRVHGIFQTLSLQSLYLESLKHILQTNESKK